MPLHAPTVGVDYPPSDCYNVQKLKQLLEPPLIAIVLRLAADLIDSAAPALRRDSRPSTALQHRNFEAMLGCAGSRTNWADTMDSEPEVAVGFPSPPAASPSSRRECPRRDD
jgi:hypothetical protein